MSERWREGVKGEGGFGGERKRTKVLLSVEKSWLRMIGCLGGPFV